MTQTFQSSKLFLKFWFTWDKFWPLRTLWRNLHMFLDILEFWLENQNIFRENCFEKMVSDWWKNVLTKLFWEESAPKNKKKHKSVHNLLHIIGTKLVLFVNCWDHIFPKQFFLFCILACKMARNMRKLWQKVRNGQNLPTENPNFRNFFF